MVMIKKLTVSTALMAVGLMTSLGYSAVAQTNQPPTQQNPTTRPATQQNPTTRPATQQSPTTRPATQSDSTQLSAFDRQFMTQAAAGNMAEIELSQLALKKSASDNVKQYAQMMVNDHTQANKTLSQLATKKGVTLPTQLDPQHQAIRAKLEKLSGKQFDQQYMSVMKQDHVKTVAMFQSATQEAQDPDVRAFATTTLPRLQAHLEMASSMMGGGTSSGDMTSPQRNQTSPPRNQTSPQPNQTSPQPNQTSPQR
jgi:putative membrane protein